MDKVRFACPRCSTVMQTGSDKIGFDVACPHCAHRFRLIEQDNPSSSQPLASTSVDAPTMPPVNSPLHKAGVPLYDSRNLQPPPSASNMAPVPNAMGTVAYSCPYCQTHAPPIWKSEVSQIGWIVFVILLLTTCVFCFAGLMIRDRYRVCSQCGIRLD